MLTSTATATPTATPTTTLTVTTSLAFGNVAVGQTATKTLTVHNTGATNSLIISSAISSDPEFSVSSSGTCGAIPVTLAPKASCKLAVAFTPECGRNAQRNSDAKRQLLEQPSERGAQGHWHR